MTAADAANAARMPLRTFRGLIAAGWPLFDPPPRPAPSWRRYGRLDVIRAATVARLMRHGFTSSEAAVSIDLAAVADDATERMNAMRSPARNGDAARGRPAGAQPRESSAQPHNPRIAAP